MTQDEHIISGTLLDDPPMTPEDHAAIAVLPAAEAQTRWDQLVDSRNSHLMLLPDDSWPSKLMANTPSRYCWQQDWNTNTLAPMQGLLGAAWPPDTPITVFWNRSTAAQTTHGVFCRNWVNFLYDDEGIVICSGHGDTGIVISNSQVWLSTPEI